VRGNRKTGEIGAEESRRGIVRLWKGQMGMRESTENIKRADGSLHLGVLRDEDCDTHWLALRVH